MSSTGPRSGKDASRSTRSTTSPSARCNVGTSGKTVRGPTRPDRSVGLTSERARVRMPGVLFLHETHLVRGYEEDAFEAAFRDGWMPRLGEDDDARLLWYCNLAHGSTWSYRVVTVTAVRDGAAYERLARRIQHGDLQDWMRELDTRRHDAHGKVLVPLPWSPLADFDLASVPSGGVDRDPVVYMQDTMWPYEDKFVDYVEASGSVYSKSLEHRDSGAPRFLDIEAGFQPAFGSHVRREVVLMQRVLDIDRLQALLMTDIPREMRAPGTWMHDALALRDKWESVLLRTARWSPAPLELDADEVA